MAVNGWNECTWLEMAENGWNQWIEMAEWHENGQKFLERMDIARMAGHGCNG